MLGILLFEGIVLVALDQTWLHYGWPTYLGIGVMILVVAALVALRLIEAHLSRNKP